MVNRDTDSIWLRLLAEKADDRLERSANAAAVAVRLLRLRASGVVVDSRLRA